MPCPPRLPPARKMSETSCRSSSFSQTPPPWPSPGRGRDPSAKIHYPAITAQRHGLSTGLLEHTRTAVSVKARLTSAAAEGQSTGASFCVPVLFPANSLENKSLSRRVKSEYTRSTRSEYVREWPPDPLWCIRSRPAYGRTAQAGSEDQTPGPAFPNPSAPAGTPGRSCISRRTPKTALAGRHICRFRSRSEQGSQSPPRRNLQKQLWPADTFVDFDRGLNKAVNHLRDA